MLHLTFQQIFKEEVTMTVDIEIIGKRIKASRKQQNMTQAELAEKSNLSNVYIPQTSQEL